MVKMQIPPFKKADHATARNWTKVIFKHTQDNTILLMIKKKNTN